MNNKSYVNRENGRNQLPSLKCSTGLHKEKRDSMCKREKKQKKTEKADGGTQVRWQTKYPCSIDGRTWWWSKFRTKHDSSVQMETPWDDAYIRTAAVKTKFLTSPKSELWAAVRPGYLRSFWLAWRLSWSRRKPRREPRWGCRGCRSGWWSNPFFYSGRSTLSSPHSLLCV